MQELITIDTIMDYFQKAVEEKTPISPSLWLDGAIKVTALLGNLDDELVEAQFATTTLLAGLLDTGVSVSLAKAKMNATEAYKSFLKLKAKRERVEQFIMLAKKRCSLQSFDQ